MSTQRKPVIKSSDMTEEMQQDAVNTALQVYDVTGSQLISHRGSQRALSQCSQHPTTAWGAGT